MKSSVVKRPKLCYNEFGDGTHNKKQHTTEYIMTKGEIPIEKNVIVTDETGHKIGLTYPKRARGLVKNGRAEYVSDCMIRLLHFAPTLTEEVKMSNVINFSAREFRFDATCEDNMGRRAFITTSVGNTEAYEIGDWDWDWTQIFCEKKLEKNTDYIFRFAMTGGHNDSDDEVSLAEIYALDGYEDQTSAWADRMTFALGKSQYAPVISKRDRTGLLRVFEIPFNTGDSENWRFVLVAQHAVAAFFAPLENSAYDGLEDLTYDRWREERTAQLRSEKPIGNKPTENRHSSSHFNDIVSYIKEATDFTSKIKMLSKNVVNNAEYTEAQFAELLSSLDDGEVRDFSNITVHSDGNNEFYGLGGSIDGAVLSFDSITMTARAFSMLVNKLGDGCVISVSNVNITDEGELYDIGVPADGAVISLSKATFPQKVLDMLNSKKGDGCIISTSEICIND